jgi:CRISPR-associated protein Cas2
MIVVTYDIANDKLRTRFSKYLGKYGYRLQYSVFKIKNSQRILNNIIAEINSQFGPKFKQEDSVIIFNLSKQCKQYSFGFAKNEEQEIIIVG